MATRTRMNQAIAMALGDVMRADDSVVVWGEDVAAAEGVFKATVGLHEEFGSRVRDTPISEMGFLGAAAGAAAMGLRPVVEIMFMEFLGVALDQLTTEAALFRYLSAGEFPVPLTVRTSAGPGLGFAAQHSQVLDHWVTGSPGLKVVAVSGPQSAYDLVRAAVSDDDPVLVIEPRRLYNTRGPVETGQPPQPLGIAAVRRPGTAATVVAAGGTVPIARAGIERAGVDAELIDLQTLWPWDQDRVLSSVSRTGRLVTVEDSPAQGGWGAAIAATASNQVFAALKAATVRVTPPPVPVPFSPVLERRYVPTEEEVALQLTSLVEADQPAAPWWVREEVAQ